MASTTTLRPHRTTARRPESESDVRYAGVADRWGRDVWVERDGVRDVLRHRGEEPIAGFAWGRRGIAARELARAILVDATGSPAVGERFCRDLTHAVVARLPEDSFELTRGEVLAWLDRTSRFSPAERPRRAAAAPS
jgi:hypothetical protein